MISTLVTVAAFGAVAGSASALDGVPASLLRADGAALERCDTDGVATSQTSAWDSSGKRYAVTGITVKGLSDRCDGRALSVAVADGAGVRLAEGSLTIPASAAVDHDIPLSPGASMTSVSTIHLTISEDDRRG